MLKHALNRIWKVKAYRVVSFNAILKQQSVNSFLIVLCIRFMDAFLNTGQSTAGVFRQEFDRLNFFLCHSFGNRLIFWSPMTFLALLFAVIFKVLPDAKILWMDVWAGSIVSAFLFILGRYLLEFYLAKSMVRLQLTVPRVLFSCHPPMGLLLIADLPVRGRVYPGVCQEIRFKNRCLGWMPHSAGATRRSALAPRPLQRLPPRLLRREK